MKNKYEFLMSLKLLEYEIKQLNSYSKENSECFELLKNKLDYVCQFMNYEENLKLWDMWKTHREIKETSKELRETSVKALCDMEKYQSICICNNNLDISNYISLLSNSVKYELENFNINSQSKVLFIGSGAFPISAITIAKEIGAEIMCLDIDIEAVEFGRNIATVSGLDSIVKFSNENLKDLAFIKKATHIIIASLVEDKLKVLDDLKNTINKNTKIILRYGNGLKSIFNYPLDKKLPAEWIQTKVNKNKSIYDTIILEKSYYECC